MAKRQLYDIPHRSRVQGALEFLVAKWIEHDERDIFEFFSVTTIWVSHDRNWGSFTNLR